jgi:hypothetical protein
LEAWKELVQMALKYAMDAKIKLEAMEKSTHTVVQAPPPGLKDFLQEFRQDEEPEKEEAPSVPPAKLSPFNALASWVPRGPKTEDDAVWAGSDDIFPASDEEPS